MKTDAKNKIKMVLGDVMVQRFRNILELLKTPLHLFRRIRAMITWKAKMKGLSNRPQGIWLHLGCGDEHFEGMLNCDTRATRATDLIMDCSNLSRFADNSIDLIFSHTFLEHLYPYQQTPFLNDCYRILSEKDSCLVFLGIPDFEVIAEAYLHRVPGHPGRSAIFDLSQVYRYTHGVPEMPYRSYFEQLHKTLFDKVYMSKFLSNAGFKSWIIFNYCYKGEKIPLNIGFLAWKSNTVNQIEGLKEILAFFWKYFADINEPLQHDRHTIHAI